MDQDNQKDIPKSEDAGTADSGASDVLFPLIYDELRHLAKKQMSQHGGNTLQPTALVHEAWLKLSNQENRLWDNRTHFFRTAALAMRQILVDRSRKKASVKRGEGVAIISLDGLEITDATQDEKILLVDEALAVLELEDPESARLIILKFFGGYTNAEIAEIIDSSERTVNRQWTFCKAMISKIIMEMKEGGPEREGANLE